MEKSVIEFEKYGIKNIFFIGQKVQCVYYHESIQYPNKLWIFEKPFTPVKLGVIVGCAGIKPYYLSLKDGKELYLYVKFKEYYSKKAIPASCVIDASKEAESIKTLLEKNKHKIGQPGYSEESYNKLLLQQRKAESYLK